MYGTKFTCMVWSSPMWKIMFKSRGFFERIFFELANTNLQDTD